MKRFCVSSAFGLILSTSAMASLDPPPQEWTGWQVRGPTGAPPVFVGTLPESCPEEDFVQDGVSLLEAFASPPQPLATGTLNLNLQESLPLEPDDLIIETARALLYNGELCYLFVRDNIRFTPYKGIVKGPVRTLIDREGNSADQAFLLLALMRACGFSVSSATVTYDKDFFVPLAGGEHGYDAASWFGVSSTGTVEDVGVALANILEPAGLNAVIYEGATPADSYLIVEHYWVTFYYYGIPIYRIDPSFKPCRKTAAHTSLPQDMDYGRSNLLACAGGTVTNDWFVQGVSGANLSNELVRMSSRLAGIWRARAVSGHAGEVAGADEIVKQDLGAEGLEMWHGNYSSPSNFLIKSHAEKNSHRAQMTVVHGGFTNLFFLDDLGSRMLWVSYTNAPGYSYPKALLKVDGAAVTNEPAGSATQAVTAVIGIRHPSLGANGWVMNAYHVDRAVTNVYAIPVGFGSATPAPGGMRQRAALALAREHGKGLQQSDPVLRARVANALGHQWLHQCAWLDAFYGRVAGHTRHSLFETGVAGHERASFFDFKTGYAFTSESGLSPFHGGRLFSSALEHGVLDQANGPDRPSVSTVRIIGLANDAQTPICLVSSSNWQTVQSSLRNYSPDLFDYFGTNVAQGQNILLPQDGQVTLNDWTGIGFFAYGPMGTGAMLSGGLNGGSPSVLYMTLSDDIIDSAQNIFNSDATVAETLGADPVDMCSGAALIDRTDLVLSGPSPLAWRRRYDSRQRWNAGALGRGWSQGYDSRLTSNADIDGMLGNGSPAASAASAVACAVVDDLLSSGESALNLTVASLVADWWASQLLGSGATVTADGKALTFTRLADGSYEPAPGVTASLSKDGNGGFVLQERLGRAWGFSTSGLLTSVQDTSGNSVGLSYSGGDSLTALTNSFGSRIDVTWTGGRIATVSDNAGRSVAYAYSPDGCLTGVTDAANQVWKMAYDAEGAFLTETDPSGVPTVRNAYNDIGQVTNQLSASGRSWVFAFAAGTRSWEMDPFGRRNYYEFTDDGRLDWAADRNGNGQYSYYDARGHTVTNIDALGRMTVNVIDASNRLARVTEAVGTPDERETAFAYDGRHRLTAVTNALGRVTRMGYDGHDRLVCVTGPDGVTVTNVYDSRGLPELTRTLDADGNAVRETSKVYNARGLPEEVVSTDAGTTLYRYDAAGNVTNVTDAMGHPLALSYNDRGQLTGTADALGHTTARLYTPEGRLEAAVDALGRTNRFFWTPGGKPAAVAYPDGGVSTNEYDIADRLAAVGNARGSRVALGLDAVGRITNRTAAAWSDSAWYDAAGRLTARVDAAAGLTVITNDWLDRPVAVTDPLGRVWASAFDALGAVTNTVDPRSRSTVYMRDPSGRLAATRYPSGRIEGNGYDALGRITAFTNAEGRVYRMGYDAQGRILAATNAAGERVFRNFYDLVGNLTSRIDGAGRVAEHQYDVLNRRVETRYAAGAWEGFGYDAAGNMTAASNAASKLSFSCDAMNRLTSSVTRVSSFQFQVSHSYDRGGLVTNVTYPGGLRVRYGYDADGRVTNVTDWAGHSFAFTRDAAGRLTALAYPAPSGVTGSWQYDANHKVSGWSFNNGSPVAGRTVTRDEAGVKLKEQVTAGLFPNPQSPRRAANTFDAADRLVSATVAVDTNTFAETYLYDGNGALTNLQSAVGDQQFEYDCAGRMTFASTGGATLSVTYDAFGNRLTTYAGNATRIWITDHADPRKRPLMETDASGAPVRYYIWGDGLLLAVVEADGTMRYCHSDEQGSVVALTDSNGTVTDQYCYGPYGTDWGHEGTNSIPFRWLGSHGVFNVGGSSLHLTRFRAYDSSLGRFLSQDPIGLGGGPNLYAYCVGNPLAYIDPLGLGAESRYDVRKDAIDAAKDLLHNEHGPVANFILDYIANILQRSVDSAYQAERTGLSPETALTLGAVQGIGEASAASATAGLNGLALGQVLGSSSLLASGTGVGFADAAARETVKTGVDPNKLIHVFDNAEHALEGVVQQYGSQEAAYRAIAQATEAAVKVQKLTGVFEVPIQIGTEIITVRGNVVEGVVRIGTAFK